MAKSESNSNLETSNEAGVKGQAPAVEQNNAAAEAPVKKTSILSRMGSRAAERKPEPMSVHDWLLSCPTNPGAYANAADRLAKAIGGAVIVDTKQSDKQERIVFEQKKIARYTPFSRLYDKEDTINKLVMQIKDGASKIIVLRGPVGSGKTEIAGILEQLAEEEPMYLLRCKVTNEISPFNDSPLSLFSSDDIADKISQEYDIPKRYLREQPSAWVTKRLEHHNYDESEAFDVVKVYPSRDKQLGVAKLDPKDNQSPDINALIGERDMTREGDSDPLDRKKTMRTGDPDAYIPGAFSKSHGGVFHGAEFFRNNPAMLNTFLEPVTEGYFTGDGGIGRLPMNQVIVLTTNDPVWQKVLKAADSDALHNRSVVIDVGYTMRMSEEVKIYKKLLEKDGLESKPCAPGTLDLLAEFAVSTRMKDGIDGALAVYDRHIRARVHNGEIPDGAEKRIPKIRELREKASPGEGLDGFSIRDAQSVLQSTFNARAHEGIEEADTLLMIETLRKFIKNADEKTIPSASDRAVYEEILDEITTRNHEKIDKIVNKAMIDADEGMCQVQFDKYVEYAKAYLNDDVIIEGGEEIPMEKVKKYLSDMESKAGETQTEEFRRATVAAYDGVLGQIAVRNAGKTPEEQEPAVVKWTMVEGLAKVIRAQFEMDISTKRHIFKAKSEADLKTEEEKRQYTRFHENMHEEGYTDTMINRMLLELM